MPWHRRRSEKLKVDPDVVASLNHKAREHSDAGAVQEIQFLPVADVRGRETFCFHCIEKNRLARA